MPIAAIDNVSRLGFAAERLSRIRVWMQRHVDAGHIPFAAAAIARHGEIAFLDHVGQRDVENRVPYALDTLVRIYSMTKPIVSAALMMLYEQGLVRLDDPVEAYIPSFKDRRVLRPDAVRLEESDPARETMTVHHLLTHRSGLTYGFNGGVLGDAYATSGAEFGPGSGGLADVVERLAGLPLLFEPGSSWTYSVSTDIVGRLVEIISGKPLDVYLNEQILGPLGMASTAFSVREDQIGRLANCYTLAPDGGMELTDPAASTQFHQDRVSTFSGGGGLVSTVPDYFRFAEMLRCRGTGNGERLLGPRTVDFMARNHLSGDIESAGGPRTFSETPFTGVGFGLGVWHMLNPALARMSGSPGDFGWGGLASTVFWVDPAEDLTVVFMTQLIPSSAYPLRKELRALVHQSLVD